MLELRLKSSNEATGDLSFEWEATNINYLDGYIELQVNFTDAIMISTGEEMDYLDLNILQMEYF